MARTTPKVEETTLIVAPSGTDAIVVGTPAWYAWLDQATTFTFDGAQGSFTARKERRGRTGWYWKAYRKRAGKVSSAYLGKSSDLTLSRMQAAAGALAKIPPAEHFVQPSLPDTPLISRSLHASAQRLPNLPIPPTALIGREREIAMIVATLQCGEFRLLTLTGPGGVGKTRLGLQVAIELRDDFADGICFVDLAALRNPDFVITTIAQTFGLVDVGAPSLLARLCDYLTAKHMLLILDNFEQVLPAAMHLAVLLATAPWLKVLVMSRGALHLAGEHEFPVVPLALPPAADTAQAQIDARHYGAVELFIQRAQAVQPDFTITPDTAPLIVQTCRRLNGLPLAIELAAARIKLLPLAILLQRLDHQLPLLTNGARDLPARHQTLRATIDWSYQLLEPAVQRLLQRLAVFEGGFTLEAAEAVCGDEAPQHSEAPFRPVALPVLDGLAALLDQSLLRPAENRVGMARFGMLDMIHEFALECLEQSGTARTLRQRHAMYYVRLADLAEPELCGADRRIWLDRLDAEHANVRTALTWALANGMSELAARLAAALGVFWDVRHRREGRDWLTAALAHDAAVAPVVRAKALRVAGWLARAQHDQAAAITLLEESLAIYRAIGDDHGCAATTTDLGWTIATSGGDITRATAFLEEGLVRCRAVGDAGGIVRTLHGLGWVEQRRALGGERGSAWALTGLGWVEQHPGILAAARALHLESLNLARAIGDVQAIAWSLQSLGLIAAAQRDYTVAHRFEEERLDIERSQDNRHGIADTLRTLGVIALRQGDYSMARAWLTEGLELGRAINDNNVIAFALRGLGEATYADGDLVQAVALLEGALSFFRTFGDNHRMAHIYAVLAQIALDRQDDAAARSLATQSIELAQSVDSQETIGICLAGLADSLARRGASRSAAQLWGRVDRQRDATQSQRAPVAPANRAQLMEATCASLGSPAFAAAWSAGQALTTEEALGVLDQAAQQLVEDRNAPPSTSSSTAAARPAGLTQRELEVLLLVAEGRSNMQIAERLVLSIATVKTYLSAIYAKLGVASRTGAMRYVIDHHLQ